VTHHNLGWVQFQSITVTIPTEVVTLLSTEQWPFHPTEVVHSSTNQWPFHPRWLHSSP
jgi:hypothetical protein